MGIILIGDYRNVTEFDETRLPGAFTFITVDEPLYNV